MKLPSHFSPFIKLIYIANATKSKEIHILRIQSETDFSTRLLIKDYCLNFWHNFWRYWSLCAQTITRHSRTFVSLFELNGRVSEIQNYYFILQLTVYNLSTSTSHTVSLVFSWIIQMTSGRFRAATGLLTRTIQLWIPPNVHRRYVVVIQRFGTDFFETVKLKKKNHFVKLFERTWFDERDNTRIIMAKSQTIRSGRKFDNVVIHVFSLYSVRAAQLHPHTQPHPISRGLYPLSAVGSSLSDEEKTRLETRRECLRKKCLGCRYM